MAQKDDLLVPLDQCSFSLIDLPNDYNKSLSKLVDHAKSIIAAKETHYSRKCEKFYIGKSTIHAWSERLFDSHNRYAWNTKSIHQQWNAHKEHGYQAMAVLTVITKGTLPPLKSRQPTQWKQQYTLALEQALITHFMFVEDDERLENKTTVPGNLEKNGAVAYVLYLAMKFEDAQDPAAAVVPSRSETPLLNSTSTQRMISARRPLYYQQATPTSSNSAYPGTPSTTSQAVYAGTATTTFQAVYPTIPSTTSQAAYPGTPSTTSQAVYAGASSSTFQTIYPGAPNTTFQTIYPSAPNTTFQTVYPGAPNTTFQTVFPGAPNTTFQTVYPGAPNTTFQTVFPGAPNTTFQTIYPGAPNTTFQTVYPGAPNTSFQTVFPGAPNTTFQTMFPGAPNTTPHAVFPDAPNTSFQTMFPGASSSTFQTAFPGTPDTTFQAVHHSTPSRETSVKPCKCGSTTHRTTAHHECPLRKPTCQCGSTTHQRTSHRDCPLKNKKK